MTKDPLKGSKVSAGAKILGSEGMTELVGSSGDAAGTEQPADKRRHPLIFKTLTKSIYEQGLFPRRRFPIPENVPVEFPPHAISKWNYGLFGSFTVDFKVSLLNMDIPNIEIDRLGETYPSIEKSAYNRTIAGMILSAGEKFADLLRRHGVDEGIVKTWRADFINAAVVEIFLCKGPLTIPPQHAIGLIYGRWLDGLVAASLLLGIPIEVSSEMMGSQEPNGDISSVIQE